MSSIANVHCQMPAAAFCSRLRRCGGAFLMDHAYSCTWTRPPDALLCCLLSTLAPSQSKNLRLVCKGWLAATNINLNKLMPRQFSVESILASFPHLRNIDLTQCTHDLGAASLAPLQQLQSLSELRLGKMVSPVITDTHLLELVPCTGLCSLRLMQCVHLTDNGALLCWASLCGERGEGREGGPVVFIRRCFHVC